MFLSTTTLRFSGFRAFLVFGGFRGFECQGLLGFESLGV